MRSGSPVRPIVLMLLTSAFLATGPAAYATVTGHQTFRETFVEENTDIGCREQVTVRIEGERTGREVDVNGGLRIAVSERGVASFTEAGQAFIGGFTRNFSLNLPARGDAVVVTQEYTTTLHGDLGDTAELHITAHVTVGSDGSVATAYAILHQRCTSR